MATDYHWTDAEKKVYDLIIGNKKLFLKECLKHCRIQRIHSFHATTGWQQLVFEHYAHVNPNYGDQILAIGRALTNTYIASDILYGSGGSRMHMGGMTIEEQWTLFIKLHLRFWKTLQKLIAKKPKKCETNTYTQDMEELLKRGFVYTSEGPTEEGNYMVYHQVLNMEYAKSFTTEGEAAKFIETHGILGCYYEKIHL